MIVTFVSQCEKKAIRQTCQILDSFANRIGDRTWQTLITLEGLKTVKTLLSKKASKNTAVSCHWARGQRHSELLWIVGRRHSFDSQGRTPIHLTSKPLQDSMAEEEWRFLPMVSALTALSALLHDWGKASALFQEKLQPSKKEKKKTNTPKGDPLRHEWVSCLLLSALIRQSGPTHDHLSDSGVNERTLVSDRDWLESLKNGEIDEFKLRETNFKELRRPLKDLPPVAGLVSWLIVSHHRLPLPNSKSKDGSNIYNDLLGSPIDRQSLFTIMSSHFGYENRFDETEFQQRLGLCFEFPHGLLSQSSPWMKQIKKWAAKTLELLPLIEQTIESDAWRGLLTYSRLALMLGDHSFSSQSNDKNWRSDIGLYANTHPQTKKLKQKLDEHLVGVSRKALSVAHFLPALANELDTAKDLSALKKKSPPPFDWQDKAVSAVRKWRRENRSDREDSDDALKTHGFFAVNMASTGCGKTIANAKVMQALSPDQESLRYVLALGLRTLTLQTGDEYMERLQLDASQLAVVIGSRAVRELHQMNRKEASTGPMSDSEADYENLGSESLEELLDESTFVDYESSVPDSLLTTVFGEPNSPASKKNRGFLFAPVLVCTIDHIIAATETRRGGRYILPTLRLLSSDLVIDEVDDFDPRDLTAIARLVHLAALLGRKVMISSATIPPALSAGLFRAYQKGWRTHCQLHGHTPKIGCAWMDEFSAKVETIATGEPSHAQKQHQEFHRQFTRQRAQKIRQQEKKLGSRRQPEVLKCDELQRTEAMSETQNEIHDKKSLEELYSRKIQGALIDLHHRHHSIDRQSRKAVSFGVVRMANIQPCLEVYQHLSSFDWPADCEVRLMPYHSRQVLLLRSEQEAHLDQVLRRKESVGEDPAAFRHPVIRQHLKNTDAKHVIFILLASPVEEVGRDHDFDWAVVEPSSYRSIIQLAGRVRRHRKEGVKTPNMALLQFNFKALKSGLARPAYRHPGFEDSNQYRLKTHDLEELLRDTEYLAGINAIPRIVARETLNWPERLADLEHHVMQDILNNPQKRGPEAVSGWTDHDAWLTAIPQKAAPFRQSDSTTTLYLMVDKEQIVFHERDARGWIAPVEIAYGIQHAQLDERQRQRLWLERDYLALLEELARKKELSMKQASLRYGEIQIPHYGLSETEYLYSDQWGLKKKERNS